MRRKEIQVCFLNRFGLGHWRIYKFDKAFGTQAVSCFYFSRRFSLISSLGETSLDLGSFLSGFVCIRVVDALPLRKTDTGKSGKRM